GTVRKHGIVNIAHNRVPVRVNPAESVFPAIGFVHGEANSPAEGSGWNIGQSGIAAIFNRRAVRHITADATKGNVSSRDDDIRRISSPHVDIFHEPTPGAFPIGTKTENVCINRYIVLLKGHGK